MTKTLRAARASDVQAMQGIRNRVKENRLSDPQRITDASYLAFVVTRSIWVAEVNSAIVGFAAIDLSAKSIWALFVDPTAEGAGVGQLLHSHLLDRARAMGLIRLTLTTAPGTRAASFYERAGWTESGKTATGESRFVLLF